MKIYTMIALSVAILSSGCASKALNAEATGVELVNEPPDAEKCQFIAEVVGTQGNFFTGDYTPTKNLVIGARNDLRNKAAEMGGNVVYVQDMKHSRGAQSAGTSNTTVVGKVYRCTP